MMPSILLLSNFPGSRTVIRRTIEVDRAGGAGRRANPGRRGGGRDGWFKPEVRGDDNPAAVTPAADEAAELTQTLIMRPRARPGPPWSHPAAGRFLPANALSPVRVCAPRTGPLTCESVPSAPAPRPLRSRRRPPVRKLSGILRPPGNKTRPSKVET